MGKGIRSLKACENLISQYCKKGGEAVTIEEGSLGLGLVVCYGKGLKTSVIQERFLNNNSSYHTVRKYNKMPKKYEMLIEQRLMETEI